MPDRALPPATVRGAYRLSDLTEPRVAVVCSKCGRRGEYDVARLLAEHGDVALPSFLAHLGRSCTNPNLWGQCAVVYESPPGLSSAPA